MKLNRLLLLSLGVVLLMACRREGCTDQTAINYDDKAKNDNGSCMYDEATPGGGGSGGSGGSGDSGGTGPGGETLPIRLTGTEASSRTISDISTNSNVVEYYIDNNWKIDAPVTIEPGVRIEMRAGGKIEILANGSLNATGTPSNKINITNAANGSLALNHIVFYSNNSNNKLIHCNISGGSNGSWVTGLVSLKESARLTMQNTSISNAGMNGLHLSTGTCRLENFSSNYFAQCTGAPVLLASLKQTAQLDNSTSYDNGNNVSRIEVGGGDVDVNTVVPKLELPYTILSSIDITSGHTEVSAGVEMIMRANIGIEIDVNGSFALAGQAGTENEVVIRGEADSRGYWRGIAYYSNNPQNNISYSLIKNGSDYSWGSATVNVRSNSQLSMDNTLITEGSNLALEVGSSATFIDNGNVNWSNCTNGGGYLP